jgi:uncharacterized protein YcaQ
VKGSLDLAEARRIALAAQGFAKPRPAGKVGVRHFRAVMDRLHVVQLDSVNVLARAHYLPFFARLGPYSRADLDRWLWRSGEVFEYWGHEASLLPSRYRPLFAHRMARYPRWAGIHRFADERADFVEEVRRAVEERGPMLVGEVDGHGPRVGWWNWSEAKIALEYLFLSGKVTVHDRVNFSRQYAAPEHVHSAELLAQPALETSAAHLALLGHAAEALGVGTVHDLADYFRIPLTDAKALLPDLADSGLVEAVAVEGWKETGYLHRDAARPRRVQARALLAPFDPLVWFRQRDERLFDFHYRIEIYTPAPKRVYGYYVLPFLLGDRIVGRIDLKGDRAAGALLVRGAHLEAGADVDEVAAGLGAEITSMAGWLDLKRVQIDAAGALGDALRATAPRE